MNDTIILAIESSCDDTAAAILKNGKLLSNVVANQEVHKNYGGVVPELASRAHQVNIIPVVDQAIKNAAIQKEAISAVAFTRGPGLMGSLMVGVAFAKSFALSLDIPMIEVNHMQAHVLAHFIEDPKPAFPFLCLTVSGGHTQIVLIKSPMEMEVVGSTVDDAAGEAFDKTGKLLGLDYPAGPHIDRLAEKGKPVFEFPEPKIAELDFSFSGLKTSILYFLKKQLKENPDFIQDNLEDICASVQTTIVNILLQKLEMASAKYQVQEVAIAGGVSANSQLRQALQKKAKANNWNVFIPKFEYCTDNAAMIGITAHFKFLNQDFVGQDVAPLARYKFSVGSSQ